MRKMDNLRWYIGKIFIDLAKNNWNLFVNKDKHVYCGNGEEILQNRCGGFVEGSNDDPDWSLYIAAGRPLAEWVPNLVHEYQHFKQLVNGTYKVRKNSDKYDLGMDVLDAWTTGKHFSIEKLWVAARRVIKWEAEAEIWAIRDIVFYKLPIDLNSYIRQATAYVLSFGFVVMERKWPNPRISEIPEIYEEIPNNTEILEDVHRNKGVKKHYMKYRDLFLEYACKPWNASEDT